MQLLKSSSIEVQRDTSVGDGALLDRFLEALIELEGAADLIEFFLSAKGKQKYKKGIKG